MTDTLPKGVCPKHREAATKTPSGYVCWPCVVELKTIRLVCLSPEDVKAMRAWAREEALRKKYPAAVHIVDPIDGFHCYKISDREGLFICRTYKVIANESQRGTTQECRSRTHTYHFPADGVIALWNGKPRWFVKVSE